MLVEPESKFLLREANAFDVGKEARTSLFTEKFLQAMLTKNTSPDNTLAQAASTATAAAVVGGQTTAGIRRLRCPEPSRAVVFHPPQYNANLRGRGRRNVHGGRATRTREICLNWSAASRRFSLILSFNL